MSLESIPSPEATPSPYAGSAFVEVADLAKLDLAANRPHVRDDVVDEPCLLVRLHQAEEITGLRKVVVTGILLVEPFGESAELKTGGRFLERRILDRASIAVRLVVWRATAVIVETHGAVPLVVVDARLRVAGTVHRELLIVEPNR